MSRLAYLIRLFSKDENGAALVEYAVIFAVVIAGTIASFTAISGELTNVFTAVTNLLDSITP